MRLEAENMYISELESKVSKLEDSLLREAEAAAEVTSKNENLKTIISEKENQVINLQSTIGSLQTQTDRIHNQIIRFVGDAIIVNADEDLFGVLYAKFAKVTKEI